MKTQVLMFLYRFFVLCALWLIAGAIVVASLRRQDAGTSGELQQSIPSAIVPFSILQSTVSPLGTASNYDSNPIVDPNGLAVPTPPGINLARTSLAAVTASSVNGGRDLDAWHYGICNAFDGGDNWHNKINYTYWLTDPGDIYPYVEVYFDVPVTICGVVVEKGPAFSATFTRADGMQQDCGASTGMLVPRESLDEIKAVRLNFVHGQGIMRVYEIRVLGVAGATDYSVGRPRVVYTDDRR